MSYDIILGRDKNDKELLGNKGLIYLGKGYVKMGNYNSLSNKIYMDVAKSHVVLVAGKRGCLEGSTLVFTNKGYKKIKDFENSNDKVLSFNEENKRFEWENAKLLKFPIENEELLKIELEDGKKLILTREHPLLITNGNELKSLLWINAEFLKEGNFLITVNENHDEISPIKIKNISTVHDVNEVYDLTVPKNHSFIANGIISHNSGKSYTLGVMTEELSSLDPETSKNIASLIFDTMGIFWTMKFENEKEKYLLDDWDLKTRKLPVKIFAPFGKIEEYKEKNIPIDNTFALKASELEAEDWIITFNISMTSQEGVLIQKVVTNLRKEKNEFTISDIQKEMNSQHNVSQDTKNIASALFDAADSWGIFAPDNIQGTEVRDLITAGTTSVLDLSVYSSIGAFNVRALVIGLISRKLFKQRMDSRKREEIQAIRHGVDYLSYKTEREVPLIWLFIDEAHEFLPLTGKTPATEALVQLLREGRQPGISLVLATQQPGQIHKDVMTQSDIVLSHRVTSKPDTEALNQIMQTYLLESIRKSMDDLPSLKGSAIILDDNSERIYSMRMRPRFTWHGGEAPTAVKTERRI
ncbi:hypothetical protein COU60_01815 [Candidatus Pacearchaeota archaeon CG10_big_fil_rev_8_21_14_0_10_34_76]|nr:MAG: hypothetical protein COU60_01815 [Candidatus Pacearchaeota archaeon CG10_big_fil_rev_8_21_14_0_10_34_76]